MDKHRNSQKSGFLFGELHVANEVYFLSWFTFKIKHKSIIILVSGFLDVFD